MYVMAMGLRGFPRVQGGVERHAEQLYPILVTLGCRVDVIVRSPYVPKTTNNWQGVTLRRIWAIKIRGVEALLHSFLAVMYAGIKRPDILHIHAVGPAVVAPLARLMGLRVVVTHHGPDYDREKWGLFSRWVLQKGEAWGMRYAHERIAISRVIMDLVRIKYGRSCNLIPNGVLLPELPATDGEVSRFSLTKGRYILCVGRFVPEKRQLDLIEAFEKAKLTGWKLALVGQIDRKDKYSLEIMARAQCVPGVVVTDFQSGQTLHELYGHAGIFVLPSSHEGLPIALLEALSYGIPVIASDIAANLEIGLPDSHYFSLGNVSSLANALSRFAGITPSLAARTNSRLWVSKRYDWKIIGEKTLRVYEKTLDLDLFGKRQDSVITNEKSELENKESTEWY